MQETRRQQPGEKMSKSRKIQTEMSERWVENWEKQLNVNKDSVSWLSYFSICLSIANFSRVFFSECESDDCVLLQKVNFLHSCKIDIKSLLHSCLHFSCNLLIKQDTPQLTWKNFQPTREFASLDPRLKERELLKCFMQSVKINIRTQLSSIRRRLQKWF